jgi:hypothetical protein
MELFKSIDKDENDPNNYRKKSIVRFSASKENGLETLADLSSASYNKTKMKNPEKSSIKPPKILTPT